MKRASQRTRLVRSKSESLIVRQESPDERTCRSGAERGDGDEAELGVSAGNRMTHVSLTAFPR